ncbi:hypothetical protein BJV82DRAFT_603608 [Fennellomyces sp. T-0311]|nr:hypothetical protein BJV82DRAFT_603608 [Fennellomyces sp. T-0311]
MTLSTSSSTHYKWKKNLAMFTKWSPRDKKLLTPTALAAATEKVIRHHRTPNSEDLTASQFASYAGIKIHNDDDDEAFPVQDDFKVHTTVLSSVAVPMARSCSERGRKAPQIWDSEFWEHETTSTKPQQQPMSIMMAPARSYASTASTSSTYSAFSDCSTTNDTSDVPQLVRSRPSVIRKGRFKIVLGNEDEDDTPTQPQVVEWRRKRSCTT